MKLESIFNPKSVAIIGATEKGNSVGRGLVDNLLQGEAERKIFMVNPNADKIASKKSYARITDINKNINLAIIAVPAPIVPEIIKQCAQKQVGGIIVISAGFKETGKEGKKREKEVARIANEADIPLVGPNCLGVIRPENNLNASFAPATPREGKIALISQSGALIDSIIDQSLGQHLGFSNIISYGNEAGIKLTDFLKYSNKDPKTKAIALYIEGLKDGRKFYQTAKKVTSETPIVALKGGKSKKAQKAVSTHTGSLGGKKEIFSAAFKQSGVKEVGSIQELLDCAKILAWQPQTKNSLGIVTNGGGAGVLATDYCELEGINLAQLNSKTTQKLKEAKGVPQEASLKNPLDIIGDAPPERYQDAVHILLEQKNIKTILIIQTIQTMTKPEKTAKIIVEAHKRWPKKAIAACFMGGNSINSARKILAENQIPNYSDPKRAVGALKSITK